MAITQNNLKKSVRNGAKITYFTIFGVASWSHFQFEVGVWNQGDTISQIFLFRPKC